jgi:hypothetical protein
MQEYAAENASLRQLSRHYSSGLISLVEYRVARHALLQALEAGTEAPEMPVLDEVPDEPDLATIKQVPFAESGEWQVDATVMTAALAAATPPEPAPAAEEAVAVLAATDKSQMNANSWTLLVVLLVVIVAIALGVLFYVFRL